VLKDPRGKFLGIADHRSNYNYLSLHQQDTIQRAIEDALNGFLAYWKPGVSPQESASLNEDY